MEYTSIKVILDKVMRNPLLKDILYETVIDLTIEFMRIVGAPNMFKTSSGEISINEYMGYLPDDLYRIIQIKDGLEANSTILRLSSDTFYAENPKDKALVNIPTYKVNGNVLQTSIEKGTLCIVYEAIMLDEDGAPLIPDNSEFTRALELYIKLYYYTILFDLGKITSPVLRNLKQEYSWAVGSCQSDFIRLDLDHAESLYTSIRNGLLGVNEHSRGFSGLGTK